MKNNFHRKAIETFWQTHWDLATFCDLNGIKEQLEQLLEYALENKDKSTALIAIQDLLAQTLQLSTSEKYFENYKEIADHKEIFRVKEEEKEKKKREMIEDQTNATCKLAKQNLQINQVNFSLEKTEVLLPVFCQIRYRQQARKCLLKFNKVYLANLFKTENSPLTETYLLPVHFLEPVRAIAVGQSAVFYDQEYLLGGGVIADVFR